MGRSALRLNLPPEAWIDIEVADLKHLTNIIAALRATTTATVSPANATRSSTTRILRWSLP